jgi:hypothetical protein
MLRVNRRTLRRRGQRDLPGCNQFSGGNFRRPTGPVALYRALLRLNGAFANSEVFNAETTVIFLQHPKYFEPYRFAQSNLLPWYRWGRNLGGGFGQPFARRFAIK